MISFAVLCSHFLHSLTEIVSDSFLFKICVIELNDKYWIELTSFDGILGVIGLEKFLKFEILEI